MADDNNEQISWRRRAILKMSTVGGVLGLNAETIAARESSSATTPRQATGKAVRQEASDGAVLIVKDCEPWEVAANEQVLSEQGIGYAVHNSNALTDYNLGQHGIVVLASTQDKQYYQNLVSVKDKLRQFVENGGVLVAHVTDDGSPCTTQWSEPFLPKDLTKVNTYQEDLTIINDGHSLTDGMTDTNLDDWYYSTHGYFDSVPDSAEPVIGIGTAPRDQVSYVEYNHGKGTVLATMQTMEWPWNSRSEDESGKTLLRNELEYATRIAGTQEPTAYISGEVVDLHGQPVPGVTVTIFERTTRRIIAETVTGDGGEFGFDSISESKASNLGEKYNRVLLFVDNGNDWFTNLRVRAEDLFAESQSLSFTLDKERIASGTAVAEEPGRGRLSLGTSTIWRWVDESDHSAQVFRHEITNTKRTGHEWEINTDIDLNDGLFFFSFPQGSLAVDYGEHTSVELPFTGVKVYSINTASSFTDSIVKWHPETFDFPTHETVGPYSELVTTDAEEKIQEGVGRLATGIPYLSTVITWADTLNWALGKPLEIETTLGEINGTPPDEHKLDPNLMDTASVGWKTDTGGERDKAAVVFEIPVRFETDEDIELITKAEWTQSGFAGAGHVVAGTKFTRGPSVPKLGN